MEVDVQNIVENFDQVFADSGDEVDYDGIELEHLNDVLNEREAVSEAQDIDVVSKFFKILKLIFDRKHGTGARYLKKFEEIVEIHFITWALNNLKP